MNIKDLFESLLKGEDLICDGEIEATSETITELITSIRQNPESNQIKLIQAPEKRLKELLKAKLFDIRACAALSLLDSRYPDLRLDLYV